MFNGWHFYIQRITFIFNGWYISIQRLTFIFNGWHFYIQRFTFILNDWHFKIQRFTFMFNGWHFYIQRFTFTFNGWHFRSTDCDLPNLIIWSSNFARVIEKIFDAAKAKSNMCEKGMAIDRAMIFRYKIFRILSNVILGQFLFENEKQPFENWVSDVWELNGKLFRFSCEGTYIYYIQKKIFFWKSWPQNSHIDMRSKFMCGRNLSTEKLTHFNPKFPFYTEWKHKNVFRRT